MYGSPHSEKMALHFARSDEQQLLLPLPCVAFDFGPFVFWLVEDCDYPAVPEPVAVLVTPPLSLMGETFPLNMSENATC